MPKIDVYLRSIEKFGAAGAVLTSGQSVALRFPTGDRHATQTTPHDALVALVREVAPPAALDQVDKQRPARFEIESNGTRYALSVTPKPGAWQVVIEAAAAPAAPAPQAPPAPEPAPRAPRRLSTDVTDRDASDFPIERGQYGNVDAGEGTVASASGSVLLDTLTAAARQARATDVYLASGVPPVMRVAGELVHAGERGAFDGETIARELGVVAPAAARAAWTEHGIATFAYGDGVGRVRATLVRDHRGPGAALRLLVAEPPPLDRLGVAREVIQWLDQRGLILVAGAVGSGKTTTLAALVRALGDKRRRVVTFDDSIEIVHATSPTVSQRAIGEHVPSLAAGVAAAMREGADAIVVGAVTSAEAAAAVVDAVLAGHLVLAGIAAQGAREAAAQLVERAPVERREVARGAVERGLLGAIAAIAKAGARSYEVVAGRSG